jgi:hypothetical protein
MDCNIINDTWADIKDFAEYFGIPSSAKSEDAIEAVCDLAFLILLLG